VLPYAGQKLLALPVVSDAPVSCFLFIGLGYSSEDSPNNMHDRPQIKWFL
jgi:hypothetical protein